LINKKNNDICIISYGPIVNAIYQKIQMKADLINAIFINNYDSSQIQQVFKKYKKIIIYERVINTNNLASDFYKYANINHFNNVEIINMSYTGYPGYGSLATLDKKLKMDLDEIFLKLK